MKPLVEDARGRQVRVLESAIPDELGVQPAVAGVTDLLVEDAVQRRRNARAGRAASMVMRPRPPIGCGGAIVGDAAIASTAVAVSIAPTRRCRMRDRILPDTWDGAAGLQAHQAARV